MYTTVCPCSNHWIFGDLIHVILHYKRQIDGLWRRQINSIDYSVHIDLNPVHIMAAVVVVVHDRDVENSVIVA